MRALVVVLGAVGLLVGCGGDEPVTPPSVSGPDVVAVTSGAFAEGGTIPAAYTCAGAGRSPDIAWRGVPDAATSLALVVTDPDAPGGTYLHWLLYDLPPADGGVAAGEVPAGALQGESSGGDAGWTAPCPPSGTHHYVFAVHALRGKAQGGTTQALLDDIGRRTIAVGHLTGVVDGTSQDRP